MLTRRKNCKLALLLMHVSCICYTRDAASRCAIIARWSWSLITRVRRRTCLVTRRSPVRSDHRPPPTVTATKYKLNRFLWSTECFFSFTCECACVCVFVYSMPPPNWSALSLIENGQFVECKVFCSTAHGWARPSGLSSMNSACQTWIAMLVFVCILLLPLLRLSQCGIQLRQSRIGHKWKWFGDDALISSIGTYQSHGQNRILGLSRENHVK